MNVALKINLLDWKSMVSTLILNLRNTLISIFLWLAPLAIQYLKNPVVFLVLFRIVSGMLKYFSQLKYN